MKKQLWMGLWAMCLAFAASAAEVEVSEAWARATAPGQDSGMVQAVITSKKAATLVGATCKCAQSVEIHKMVNEGGMMKMRQVDAIELPAGEAVDLGAKGYHLMLIGLKKPLKEGKKVTLTLQLRQANGKIRKARFSAPIRGLTAGKPQSAHQHQ